MTEKPRTVEQWRAKNRNTLIDCRWCGQILPGSCHSYQARVERRIIHFSGDANPLVRVNADFLRCYQPTPCPNLLPDKEVAHRRARGSGSDQSLIDQKEGVGRAREFDTLTNPNHMLNEDNRRRSLLKR